jgi:hypothetical protein
MRISLRVNTAESLGNEGGAVQNGRYDYEAAHRNLIRAGSAIRFDLKFRPGGRYKERVDASVLHAVSAKETRNIDYETHGCTYHRRVTRPWRTRKIGVTSSPMALMAAYISTAGLKYKA